MKGSISSFHLINESRIVERGWYAVEERKWRMMKENSTKTVKNEYLGGSSNDCDKEDVGA